MGRQGRVELHLKHGFCALYNYSDTNILTGSFFKWQVKRKAIKFDIISSHRLNYRTYT